MCLIFKLLLKIDKRSRGDPGESGAKQYVWYYCHVSVVCDWLVTFWHTWLSLVHFRHAHVTQVTHVNVYKTTVFRGCHSFSDIVMAAYAMLKRRDPRCFYDPVVGVQYISDESDEVTSHPIERVPSLSGTAADREIVDVDLHTLEQKAVDGNTAFVVGGLVIEKVRTCFLLPRRPRQSSVRKTSMRERQHLLPRQSTLRWVSHGLFYMVDLIRPVYGQSVRRRCKRLISYEPMHAYVQAEHFGRDTCVSHHYET